MIKDKHGYTNRRNLWKGERKKTRTNELRIEQNVVPIVSTRQDRVNVLSLVNWMYCFRWEHLWSKRTKIGSERPSQKRCFRAEPHHWTESAKAVMWVNAIEHTENMTLWAIMTKTRLNVEGWKRAMRCHVASPNLGRFSLSEPRARMWVDGKVSIITRLCECGRRKRGGVSGCHSNEKAWLPSYQLSVEGILRLDVRMKGGEIKCGEWGAWVLCDGVLNTEIICMMMVWCSVKRDAVWCRRIWTLFWLASSQCC